MSSFVFAAIVVIAIVFIWFLQGSLPFSFTPGASQPQGTGTISPNESSQTSVSEEESKIEVQLSNGSGQWADNPNEEYIEISASYSNKKPVSITGWTLTNRKGEKFPIPKGANLVYSARVNAQGNIILEPGARAYVITGPSPINTSFRLNLCTGFFNEQYQFRPSSLPQNCPAPYKEPGAENEKDTCFSYLKTLSTCRTPASPPQNLDSSCHEFISRRVNYAGCVEARRNDSDFYANEWRVYLEQKSEIWSGAREKITLFDQNLSVVAETSY